LLHSHDFVVGESLAAKLRFAWLFSFDRHKDISIKQFVGNPDHAGHFFPYLSTQAHDELQAAAARGFD
jgi:hypothetical protein